MLGPVARMAGVAARGAAVVARRNIATTKANMGGGWSYREVSQAPPQWNFNMSYAVMTVTWWWIFHGVLTEPAHLFPFMDSQYPGNQELSPYPENSATVWTDEELGIPPDDE